MPLIQPLNTEPGDNMDTECFDPLIRPTPYDMILKWAERQKQYSPAGDEAEDVGVWMNCRKGLELSILSN